MANWLTKLLKPSAQSQTPSLKLDGWSNFVTGLGTGRDKRTFNLFDSGERLAFQDAETLWRGSDMAARIVETLPNEMLNDGYDVLIASDTDTNETDDAGKEATEAVECDLEDLQVNEHVREALYVARAMGGAAIILGIDDGQDSQMPVNESNIQSLAFLTVLNPLEIWPVEWYTDVRNEKFGLPAIYGVQRQTTGGAAAAVFFIHESRMIRIEGVKTSRRQQAESRGWGDSVLFRMQQFLADFDMTFSQAALLLSDFSQGVFKIAGLAEAVAQNQKDVVKNRIEAIDLGRSVLRSVVIDAEEDFERKSTPLTGYPEMMDRLMQRLAALAQMPVSLLMGQSPAGLNATGDSELRWFFRTVTAEQKRKLKPILSQILHYMFLSKDGPTGGSIPKNWSIKFRPLWQLSDQEQADVRLKVAQADQLYIQNQVLMPEEVALARFGGDEYSLQTQLDADLRDKLSKVAELEMLPADEMAATKEEPLPDQDENPKATPGTTPAPDVLKK